MCNFTEVRHLRRVFLEFVFEMPLKCCIVEDCDQISYPEMWISIHTFPAISNTVYREWKRLMSRHRKTTSSLQGSLALLPAFHDWRFYPGSPHKGNRATSNAGINTNNLEGGACLLYWKNSSKGECKFGECKLFFSSSSSLTCATFFPLFQVGFDAPFHVRVLFWLAIINVYLKTLKKKLNKINCIFL